MTTENKLYRHATPAEVGADRQLRSAIRKGFASLPASRGAPADRERMKQGRSRLATIADGTHVLAALAERAKLIMTPGPALARVLDWIKGATEQLHTADYRQRQNEVMVAASRGDQAAQELRAAAVRETIGALMMPSATWANFFMQVNLDEDDIFLLESRVPAEVGVEAIGPDGRADTVPAMQHFDFSAIPLYFLSTDDYEFPLVDLTHGGRVADAALANIDMARDFAAKLDFIIQSFHLVGATGSRCKAAFDITDANLAKRDYVPHSRVDTSNFPTGNIIVLATNTVTSGPRLDLLRAVIAYATQWGSGAWPDGDLVPVAIHVPSKDAYRFTEEFSISAPVGNSYTENVASAPFQLHFGGYNFTIIPDNTLSPAGDTHAYVRFNKPTGLALEKPSLGRDFRDDTYESQKANIGRVSRVAAIGQAMPRQWCPNILAVRYRNNA